VGPVASDPLTSATASRARRQGRLVGHEAAVADPVKAPQAGPRETPGARLDLVEAEGTRDERAETPAVCPLRWRPRAGQPTDLSRSWRLCQFRPTSGDGWPTCEGSRAGSHRQSALSAQPDVPGRVRLRNGRRWLRPVPRTIGAHVRSTASCIVLLRLKRQASGVPAASPIIRGGSPSVSALHTRDGQGGSIE